MNQVAVKTAFTVSLKQVGFGDERPRYSLHTIDTMRASTKDAHCQAVQKAIAYMSKCFRDPIRLKDIATHACMSTYHFSRVFKHHTQKSPQKYLQEKRLCHAAALLSSTSLPITDVCYQSGFNRLDYFCSVFVKAHHQTPSDFREACRVGREKSGIDGTVIAQRAK